MTYIRFMCGTYICGTHVPGNAAVYFIIIFFKIYPGALQSTIIQAWCLVFGGMFMLK